MLTRLTGWLVAVTALAGGLAAPAGAAAPDVPPSASAGAYGPHVVISRVAEPLRRFDISFGEVPGGEWRRVTVVHMKLYGCAPGQFLYWSDGPAYEDGRRLSGAGAGLGFGEAYCEADGTSSFDFMYYREPKRLHPGWIRTSVTVYDGCCVDVFATGHRRVWIPRHHHRH